MFAATDTQRKEAHAVLSTFTLQGISCRFSALQDVVSIMFQIVTHKYCRLTFVLTFF